MPTRPLASTSCFSRPSRASCAATWLALVLGVAGSGTVAGIGGSAAARAGDWPQILGPQRNGVASGEKLPATWPAQGPATVWKFPLGQGYAGPAVAGQRVVVFHRVAGQERVEAIDLATGKSNWKTDFPASYRGGIDPDVGPRCVPVIHDGTIYVYGAGGAVHAVELATGKARWTRELLADYRGDEGYFGAGSTPLVADGKLLVNVGGREGAGIVALELATGRTAWQATDEGASYSSPILGKIGARPAAIFVTRLNCVAVSPATGDVLFRLPFGKRGPTVNAANPVLVGDQLFLTASYNIGGQLYKVAADSPRPVWSNDESLSSQYATAVVVDGHLYGTHGREDAGRGELRCVRLADGKVSWSEADFGVANLIVAGDKFLAVRTDGKVVLAKVDPKKFIPLATATASADTTRALPALASGRLLLRTNVRGGDGELLCLDVTAP